MEKRKCLPFSLVDSLHPVSPLGNHNLRRLDNSAPRRRQNTLLAGPVVAAADARAVRARHPGVVPRAAAAAVLEVLPVLRREAVEAHGVLVLPVVVAPPRAVLVAAVAVARRQRRVVGQVARRAQAPARVLEERGEEGPQRGQAGGYDAGVEFGAARGGEMDVRKHGPFFDREQSGREGVLLVPYEEGVGPGVVEVFKHVGADIDSDDRSYACAFRRKKKY